MHRNRHRPAPPTPPHRSLGARVLRSAAIGALAGLGVAGVCVAVGVLRAAMVILGGRHLPPLTATDLAGLERLAGSFVAGGITVGLAGPWLRRRVVRHLAFYLGGIVAMIGLADALPLLRSAQAGITWMFIVPLGVIVGLFGVYYFEHDYPRAAGLREAPDP